MAARTKSGLDLVEQFTKDMSPEITDDGTILGSSLATYKSSSSH